MSQVLINYNLNAAAVKNADGSYVGTVVGCTVVNGPGVTPYGTFAKVFNFAAGSKVTTVVQASAVDKEQFTATVIFKPTASALGMQSLVDCNTLPFGIWVQPGSVTPSVVGVQVKSSENGLAITDTQFRTTDLNMAGWNKIDLVYDRDTLALVLNDKLVGVTGLPNGILAPATGTALVLGQGVTGNMQFIGQMAAFTFTKGIPATLATLIAEARAMPEWLISYKYMSAKDFVAFGNQASAVVFEQDIPAYVRRYANGILIAPVGTGAAYELHGAIYTAYKADSTLKAKLGLPLSDEIDASVPGARKNLFTKGGIYYSSATGAVPMYGIMYADYEAIGGPKSSIGLPTKAEVAVPGGRGQDFERGQMLKWDGSTAAFALSGPIWEEFKRLGGITHSGFPLANIEVLKNALGFEIGYSQKFQLSSIFYHSSTGARELRGEFLSTYLRAGGMNSPLGLPTSNELAVPNLVNGKAVTFQRGTIVSGNGKTRIACPFTLFVGRVDTKESENDGSQNDPIIRMIVTENGVEVFNKRFPESGYINEKNIVELNASTAVLLPNDINKTYTLSVHCVDYDAGLNGANDDLGTFTTTLNAQNGWGWFLSEDGTFNSGAVKLIKNITWAVKPPVPANYKLDFWKVINKSTTDLSVDQGAQAIRDLDSRPEDWDPFDAIDSLFFNACIKGAGANGNCYGFSTYALKTWKGVTLHTPPLQAVMDSPTLWNEFRVHQARQFGDKMVGWTIDQFTASRTQDPKGAFTRSRDAFNRGDHPVLSFTDRNNLLKAKGHCVVPIAWDDSTPIWKITVFDPNLGGATRDFVIDSVQNTWNYAELGWSGGFKTGGRLFHAPYSIVAPRPRTPYWAVLGRVPDAIAYFFNNFVETVNMLDDAGVSLNMSEIVDPTAANTDKKYLPIPNQSGTDGNNTLLICPTGGKLSAATLQSLGTTTTPKWSTLNLGGGFTHKMIGKGAANSPVSIGMTHHLSSVAVTGLIDPGEALSFSARNYGSPERQIVVKPAKARNFTITVSNQFGVKGDRLSVQFAVPTAANTEAKFLIDPAMTRIDMLTAGAAMQTVITVKGTIGGMAYTRTIDATIDGGIRLNLHNVLKTGILTGGKITSLKGQATQEFSLRSR